MANLDDVEKVLTSQISDVVGDVGKYDGLVSDLVEDVFAFESWYGIEPGSKPWEVSVDYGNSLSDLVAGNAPRRTLAKTIRTFVVMELNNSDKAKADEVVRLAMERIVGWRKWYPSFYEDQNFAGWLEEETEYSLVYDENPLEYGAGDNGADGAF